MTFAETSDDTPEVNTAMVLIAIFVLPMQNVAQKWILQLQFWSLSKDTSGGQIRNCNVTLYLIMNSMKIVIPLHFSGGSRIFEKGGGRGNDKVTLGLFRLNINV